MRQDNVLMINNHHVLMINSNTFSRTSSMTRSDKSIKD